jgi:hypothetical protein
MAVRMTMRVGERERGRREKKREIGGTNSTSRGGHFPPLPLTTNKVSRREGERGKRQKMGPDAPSFL